MSRHLTTGVISQYWPEHVFGPELILDVMIFDTTQIPEEPPVWRVPSWSDYTSLQTAASNHSGSPSTENARYLKSCWQVKTSTNCVLPHCHRDNHPRWMGSYWNQQTIYCGTNSMKWNMLPNGYRQYNNGAHIDIGYQCHLGTIDTVDHEGDIRVFSIGSSIHSQVFGFYDFWHKGSGLGTRVVRNLTSAESQMPDMTLLEPYVGNNGVVYEVRKYHARAWTTEALCETLWENGDPITFTTDPATWVSFDASQTPAASAPSQAAYLGVIPDIIPQYGLFYNWWAMVDPRSLVKTDQGWEPPPPPQYEGVIHIPVNEDAVGTVNFNVDWGDGNQDTGVTGSIDHWYETAGLYQVQITGQLPGLRFDLSGWNRLQLLNIAQWGDIAWDTLYSAFRNCYQLNVTALDTPNLSQIHINNANKALERTFENCLALTGGTGLTNWEVDEVLSFNYMFRNTALNYSLGGWGFKTGAIFQEFLTGIDMSSDNYDLTLIGWANRAQQKGGPMNLTIYTGPLEYSAIADPSRDILVNTYNWTLVGDVYIIEALPPQNASVNVSIIPGSALLSWSSVKAIDGYNVYLKPEGGFFSRVNTTLISSSATSYLISDPGSGNYEAYVVSVYQNQESGPSDIVPFTIT